MASATVITHKLVLLLAVVAAAISVVVVVAAVAVAHDDVDAFIFPVFDAKTTEDLAVASINDSSILPSASHLFGNDYATDAVLLAHINRSAGFLLLSRPVDTWRPGGAPAALEEASFNTSFTVLKTTRVAFVVLSNYTAADDGGSTGRNASSGSLASVEVGPVRSYGRPDDDDQPVSLNVTVTPNNNGTVTAVEVWIEFDAASHRLAVYVAGGGGDGDLQARPATALLDARWSLAGQRRTTERAFFGFFAAGSIQDILVGVSGWNLTVDSFKSDGGWKKKGTSSWCMIILLAVLGSVAATT